jgi:hypothetical protein
MTGNNPYSMVSNIVMEQTGGRESFRAEPLSDQIQTLQYIEKIAFPATRMIAQTL